MAQILIQYKASLDAQAVGGTTALHVASWNGHTGVVEIFLSNGACVKQVTRDGQTALFYAVRRRHPEVVRTLLQYVLLVNHQADGGFTARQLAFLNQEYTPKAD